MVMEILVITMFIVTLLITKVVFTNVTIINIISKPRRVLTVKFLCIPSVKKFHIKKKQKNCIFFQALLLSRNLF